MIENGYDAGGDWLKEVRRIYLSGSGRKLADLERAIAGLEMNPESHSHERRLRRLLHNLIGSGGSYGFPAVSDAARGMSDCLRQRDAGVPVNAEILSSLRSHLDRLKRIFQDAMYDV